MKRSINSNEEFLGYMRHAAFGKPIILITANFLIAALIFFISVSDIADDDNFPFEEFSAGITCFNGEIQQSPFISKTLEKHGAWAMLLDGGGEVIWEFSLPDRLRKHYTPSDIAMFSRWYLEDYPVKVWKHELGLLVIGFQPKSFSNKDAGMNPRYSSHLIWCTAIMLMLDFLSILYLFLQNIYRFQKAVSPVLNGIHCLSRGEAFKLEETGKIAYINAELNRAGEMLLKKDNSRINWIRGVSHDIRTPLSVIMGYANEMENNASLPDEIREQAAIISRHGDKLGHLISDLNLAAKLEYGVQSIRQDTIVPAELVRVVVSSVLNAGIPECFDIEIHSEPASEIPVFTGDSVLIQRMLANLIRNSIAHNTGGCRIRVSTGVCGNTCFFEVSDTGCGIKKSLMDRLNSSESAFETSYTDENGEHGLGLKIVLKIVELHGGNVVFSDNTPIGTTVKAEFAISGKI